MFTKQLTPRQEKLISEACNVQLEALTQLHEHGHEDFEEYLKEYPDAHKDDVTLELLENVIFFEEVRANPGKLWKMTNNQLLVMQFILLKKLPEKKYTLAKRSLYHKLQDRINELNIQLN